MDLIRIFERKYCSSKSDLSGGLSPSYTMFGKYVYSDSWTNGFLGGIQWYLFSLTKDESWKSQAVSSVDKVQRYADETDNQDIGYILLPTLGSGYAFTGDLRYRSRLLAASENLMTMVTAKGFLKCSWKLDQTHTSGVDSFMNIRLFLWAYENTKDERFLQKASDCINEAACSHIQNNGAVMEYVNYDEEYNVVGYENTNANSLNSVWSRGQSWAVYGLCEYVCSVPNEYIESLLNKALGFYIDHLQKTIVPKWDLVEQGSYDIFDSSAGVILLSALIKLKKFGLLDERYFSFSEKLKKKLFSHEFINTSDEHDGVLIHCSTPLKKICTPGETGIWGDYYLLECIYREYTYA